MHVVIALCHFCENHGPRVVMTCQPLRGPHCSSDIGSGSFDGENDPIAHYGDYLRDNVVDVEERCEACTSFGPNAGIVSNDHEAETSYFSTQSPVNETVQKVIREMCLRSLTAEMATPVSNNSNNEIQPELGESLTAQTKVELKLMKSHDATDDAEGSVMFGDSESYTLARSFKLKDAKARGFNRLYSLVVVSSDKMTLLNNYDFFMTGLTQIIDRLQELAQDTFAFEQGEDGEAALHTALSRMLYLPNQFFPRTISLDTSRSLKILVRNDDIFSILHRQMLYLLRSQSALLTDMILEGVPTQDMLVAIEREPESVEESALISSVTDEDSQANIRNLKHVVTRLLALEAGLLKRIIWNVLIGNQIVVKSSGISGGREILFALATLIPIGCVRIAANINHYMDRSKCNFLGCSSNVEVPSHFMENAVIMSIIPTHRAGKSAELLIENCPETKGKEPRLLKRYIQLLMDRKLPDIVLDSAIRSTRTEWLNHAKLLFQLSRQRERRICLDDVVVNVLHCEAEDSPVLLFFQTGLSRHYKQIVLNTVRSSSHSSGSPNSSGRRR